jgi:hypothetical protein
MPHAYAELIPAAEVDGDRVNTCSYRQRAQESVDTIPRNTSP